MTFFLLYNRKVINGVSQEVQCMQEVFETTDMSHGISAAFCSSSGEVCTTSSFDI